MSVGEMSVGEMSIGEMSIGEMSVGEMSVGEMSWIRQCPQLSDAPHRCPKNCESF